MLIVWEESTGNDVRGNSIGTGVNGSKALPNGGEGVEIRYGASYNMIGNGNLISGNARNGVNIHEKECVGNEVLGNYIGYSEVIEDEVQPLPNGGNGVQLGAAEENLIGPNNVISGNRRLGIYIQGSKDTDGDGINNRVFNNLIGVNPITGELLANGEEGVRIYGSSWNLVEHNVLCGAGVGTGFIRSDGVRILDEGSFGNTISYNYIGTNPDGDQELGNGLSGVKIYMGAHDNTIGPGNVISGNQNHGILIESGEGVSCNNNVVLGNFIGTTVDGLGSFGNGSNGIELTGTVTNTTIGPGNVISGNDTGVNISGVDADSNVVFGNYIGTDKDGEGPIPNYNGVKITDGKNNLIGGPEEGAMNIISGNNHNGVWIVGSGTADSLGNAVQGNYIGLAANGIDPLGNEAMGVAIRDSSRKPYWGS